MKIWARPMEIKRPIDPAFWKEDFSTDRMRALGKQAREKLTGQERSQKSREALQNLCALSEWQTSDTVLTFVSFGTEICTQELIQTALLQKKAVYCPKVFPPEKRMAFYRIGGLSELKPGFGGILEPPESREIFVPGRTDRALMVVPGTVFDRQGNRMGYGGGYYDRYAGAIARQNRPVLAGLCFACQLTEQLPAEDHDIRMDLVVTEDKVIRTSPGA